eukprot:TRINITY_DN71123_c0_g1_i1.p1 TRINITY_DN71123_c0_g1~~TRINITY_DN71123_c0_g1_i1.p1  ORF type:complete len:527 (-),score=65.02 TRINITY_DN71123_c0_g1_i1:13-1593(-)
MEPLEIHNNSGSNGDSGNVVGEEPSTPVTISNRQQSIWKKGNRFALIIIAISGLIFCVSALLRVFFIEPRQAIGCSKIKNHGAYLTAGVMIGTPAQSFDLIVDTRSNVVVVPSCECADRGKCLSAQCFEETVSSTFSSSQSERTVNLTYIDATVAVKVSTDVITVSKLTATLQDGLLLATDMREYMREFVVSTMFGGILGLGNPTAGTTGLFTSAVHSQRFSICDTGDDKGGLMFGGPTVGKKMQCVGSRHWSLMLEGVSTGQSSSVLEGCASRTAAPQDAKNKGCQAIIDSGTTLIMGPRPQVLLLLRSLCAAWPRCRIESDRGSEPAEVFARLCLSCEDWAFRFDGSDELDRIPSIFFRFSDLAGEKDVVELSWRASIMSMPAGTEGKILESIFGTVPRSLRNVSSGRSLVCVPAFGSIDVQPEKNDRVWILGLPLFFERAVGFEVSTWQPSLSFGTPPCDSCSGFLKSVFAAGSADAVASFPDLPAPSRLRRFHGQLRIFNRPISDGSWSQHFDNTTNDAVLM